MRSIDGLALMCQCVKFCDFKFSGLSVGMAHASNMCSGVSSPLCGGNVDP